MNKFTLRNKLGDMLGIRRYRYKIYIQLYISIQNGKKMSGKRNILLSQWISLLIHSQSPHKFIHNMEMLLNSRIISRAPEYFYNSIKPNCRTNYCKRIDGPWLNVSI